EKAQMTPLQVKQEFERTHPEFMKRHKHLEEQAVKSYEKLRKKLNNTKEVDRKERENLPCTVPTFKRRRFVCVQFPPNAANGRNQGVTRILESKFVPTDNVFHRLLDEV